MVQSLFLVNWMVSHIPFSPDTVEDVAIGINPQHDVLHGRVVDEGALGVDEEHVRDPDLLDQACVKGTALVAAGGEGQPVVLPVVPKVQRHGEVLETRAKANRSEIGDTGWTNGDTSGTYHVDFRYAVDALDLDVDADGKSRAYKWSNLVNLVTSARDYACVNPAVEL